VAATIRDRVTIDLRGLRPAVGALAASRRMTVAALARAALVAVLDRCSVDPTASDEGSVVTSDRRVKFTVRLHEGDVERVIQQARALGMSYWTYLSYVIDGAPPPVIVDGRETIAALASSTDQPTVLAAGLEDLLRSIRCGAIFSGHECLAAVQELGRHVRPHLELASALMAELMPARPRRRVAPKRHAKRAPS